jgi:hypothetical protein
VNLEIEGIELRRKILRKYIYEEITRKRRENN